MSFDLLPTPNPNEFAVRVWASPMQVLQKMSGLEHGVTTLAQFGMATAPVTAAGLASYVYVKAAGKREDGAMGFVFGKPKTEAEKNTPFDSPIRTENYGWEGVMLDYHAEPNFRDSLEMRDGNGTAFFQNKWNSRYKLMGPIQGATDMQYHYFLSPTKWTNLRKKVIQQPVHVPVGHLPGDTSDPVGNVLVAKRIRVPMAVLGPTVLSWRTIEPTVPAGRVRHVADDDQEETESGLWMRTLKIAIPPVGVNVIKDK